ATQTVFAVHGMASGSLPSCAPGGWCDPGIVLTPISGYGDFQRHKPFPLLYFSGSLNIMGTPFQVPTNKSTVLHPITSLASILACLTSPCTSPARTIDVNLPGYLVLTFTPNGTREKVVASLPEPGSIVLFGTGFLGALWRYKRS